MLTEENLNETLADVVMNRPREFFIGSKRYCLWSPSLGQSLLLQRQLEDLEIDGSLLQLNPSVEALRIAKYKRDEACRILAILSLHTYRDLSNSKTIESRASEFKDSLSEEELAQLILIALSFPKAEEIINLCGLREQQYEQAKISKLKNKDGNLLSFGGKTMFGTLIAPACEKLHITPRQAVWDFPLIQLQLILADAVNTIYLSPEERKETHIKTQSSTNIDAENPANFASILAMDWS